MTTTPNETYRVKFNNGIIVYDTHNLFDEKQSYFMSCINGIACFSLKIKSFNKKEKSKIKILLNGLSQLQIFFYEDKDEIVGSIPIKAGDRIDIEGSNFAIWDGNITVVPLDSLFSTKNPNDTPAIEYKETIVKINKSGYYKISTENGQLKIEPKYETDILASRY